MGNTTRRTGYASTAAVHPHARGEHGQRWQRAGRQHGSSPRTWGTLLRGHADRRPVRFIPTHVGNTAYSRVRSRPRTVHPHARGEHMQGHLALRGNAGSSPRTWGTQFRTELKRVMGRFIPTHVGNTFRRIGFVHWCAVHPHARGEHITWAVSDPRPAGSSPRTWGTLRRRRLTRRQHRFIPTHVGNTPRTAGYP